MISLPRLARTGLASLAVFALSCSGGGGSDPDNGLQFEVQLELQNGEIIKNPIEYEYPRCPEGLAYTNGERCLEPNPPNGWDNGIGQTFDSLQTAQFILQQGDQPARLRVRDNRDGATCMFAYFQGPATQGDQSFASFTMGLDDTSDGYAVAANQLTPNTPIQLTAIPLQQTANPCSDPEVDAEAGRALAVWIAYDPPSPPAANPPFEVVCMLDGSIDFDQDYVDAASGCKFDKPQWRMDEEFGRVLYTGSLWTLLTDAQSDSLEKVWIELDPNLTLPSPISSTYAAFYYTSSSNVADCQAAVEAMNRGQRPPNDNCEIELKEAFPVYTLPTNAQFTVSGFGRVSGLDVLKKWDPNNAPQSPNTNSLPIGQWQDFAEFEIRSLLLALSSSESTATPAIQVQHSTLAWTAKIQKGPAELNSSYVYLENPPAGDEYGKPVHVFDYKQVGSWLAQSDGPEVMGADSEITYSYLHIADDAIKISAQNVLFNQISVLKGNSGGVVNLGAYGLNRGVEGALAENIWVPRITHYPNSDNALGLIISRTCPYFPQSGAPAGTDPGLFGAGVNSLYVPSLGDKGYPNSINGLVRLGLEGGCDLRFTAPNFKIGDIDFTNFAVYLAPQPKSSEGEQGYSVLFDDQNPGTTISWEPVRFFGDTPPFNPNPDSNNAVVSYPGGVYDPNAEAYGFYICGQNVNASQDCWTTEGQGITSATPTTNLFYLDVPSDTAKFPGFN